MKVTQDKITCKTNVFWCDNCDIPIASPAVDDYSSKQCSICQHEVQYFSTDIRPVFGQEKLIASILTGEKIKRNDPAWYLKGGYYFVNGKKIKRRKNALYDETKISQAIQSIESSKVATPEELYQEYQSVIQANKIHLDAITNEALMFIRDTIEKYPKRKVVVSFSGGKDSSIVSDLVLKATGGDKCYHIFGDTTLEFPTTYQYIKDYRKMYGVDIYTARNRKEKNTFFELCKKIGPPSRIKSWCCTIFKSGPLDEKFKSKFKDTKILSFLGMRAVESNIRSTYKRIAQSPKIASQVVALPILNWSNFDVWLYILANKLLFNSAYFYGYERVGCWCCPNNSIWSEFLAKILFSEYAQQWNEFLIEFAKTIGKPDPVEYIQEGGWKARHGSQGLEISGHQRIEQDKCGEKAHARNYFLSKDISTLVKEYFKPFGRIVDVKDKGFYIIDMKTQKKSIEIETEYANNHVRVTIYPDQDKGHKYQGKSEVLQFRHIEMQLRKYQVCLYDCNACVLVCPFNAINKDIHAQENTYTIKEDSCTHCQKCINYFSSGCLISKVTDG